jgi:signal recognition particle GTPase
VILVVGVNGTGKTTTIAKLARRFASRGAKVQLAAGDTFRAAAIEQLQMWAGRIGVPVVAHKAADPRPSSTTRRRGWRDIDAVIVDTAGRLHTKANLMDELAKIRRTIAKRIPTPSPRCCSCPTPRLARTPGAGQGVPRGGRFNRRRAGQARRNRAGGLPSPSRTR